MSYRTAILSMDVNITDISYTMKYLDHLVSLKSGAYVCVSNVHMCIEVYRSPEFQDIVNKADFVIPDGKPLALAQRMLGHRQARQVRGQDIMDAICQHSGSKMINIGFYGGSSIELLNQIKSKLRKRYPDINITYSFSPPFRPLTDEENQKVISDIHTADVDILFVGLGCPKQERWMADHKESLNCVMLGVGAAYDFIAGSKKHAPRWVQAIGMEWFFRLCSEPRRLWKRYLSTNPSFLWLFSKQLFRARVPLRK
ncbi:WecB/TagA/CpsF family glycosyltransferase [Vibrio sp. WJH972]